MDKGIEVYPNQFKPWNPKVVNGMHLEVGVFGNKMRTATVFFDTEVSSSVEARLIIDKAIRESV